MFILTAFAAVHCAFPILAQGLGIGICVFLGITGAAAVSLVPLIFVSAFFVDSKQGQLDVDSTPVMRAINHYWKKVLVVVLILSYPAGVAFAVILREMQRGLY